MFELAVLPFATPIVLQLYSTLLLAISVLGYGLQFRSLLTWILNARFPLHIKEIHTAVVQAFHWTLYCSIFYPFKSMCLFPLLTGRHTTGLALFFVMHYICSQIVLSTTHSCILIMLSRISRSISHCYYTWAPFKIPQSVKPVMRPDVHHMRLGIVLGRISKKFNVVRKNMA